MTIIASNASNFIIYSTFTISVIQKTFSNACSNEIARSIAELILYLIFNITFHPLYTVVFEFNRKMITNITRTFYISETSKLMYSLDF